MANETKPKSSLGCCLLKVFLVLMVLGLIGAGLLGYGVYRTASWFSEMAEAAPTTYPPLAISTGENQDINRIITELHESKSSKEVIDESITPNVFNGLIDKILNEEKKNGKTPDVTAVRGGFEGEHFALEFSGIGKGKQAGQFINGKATFDLEVVDGEIKNARIHSLKVGGRDAPWAVLAFVNNFIISKLSAPNDPETREAAEGLKAFKLFKREGDRLHVILDPALFKENQIDGPNPTTPVGKSPEKNDF